jgi:hypothetical protein
MRSIVSNLKTNENREWVYFWRKPNIISFGEIGIGLSRGYRPGCAEKFNFSVPSENSLGTENSIG